MRLGIYADAFSTARVQGYGYGAALTQAQIDALSADMKAITSGKLLTAVLAALESLRVPVGRTVTMKEIYAYMTPSQRAVWNNYVGTREQRDISGIVALINAIGGRLVTQEQQIRAEENKKGVQIGGGGSGYSPTEKDDTDTDTVIVDAPETSSPWPLVAGVVGVLAIIGGGIYLARRG